MEKEKSESAKRNVISL